MHVGLIGYGSIAKSLLELLAHSPVKEVTIFVRSISRMEPRACLSQANQALSVQYVTSLDEFLQARPDLVVECAGHSAVSEHVPAVLQSGITVVVASIGALADEKLSSDLNIAATKGSSRVVLPSGAIGGLDMLRAISQQCDVEVTYQSIKPAHAWEGSPASDILDLSSLNAAATFFSGSGREASLSYPKNANVVAALALAGAGFDKMQVELIADPLAQCNQHTYRVVSPICRFSMAIEATPSAGNAKTSMTTVLSILQEIADFHTLKSTNAN